MTTFSMTQMAKQARSASHEVAALTAQQKQTILMAIADKLVTHQATILAANQQDLANSDALGISDAMKDRLLLDPERINGIADAVRDIAQQADPVGSMSQPEIMNSGIQVQKMKIPLGVIAMIYESRPNVTVDAAALCFKAGNAVVLRGGKEALHSNLALADCIHQALSEAGVDPAAVSVVPETDRAVMNELMTLNQYIDLIIPRGGEGLIRFVSENSRIPVIQHYKGVCHLYVDAAADLTKAMAILDNGKTQRTGVCNALETLLVDESVAADLLPQVATLFADKQVKVHACESSINYFDDALPATTEDWDAEYLALEIAVRVVPDFDAAILHLQQHSSQHTEVIVTENQAMASEFLRRVHSAVVMVNASSRFSDGGELGLGAEIGISTSKLHAYGPMGVESLTTEKFVVLGDGHVRG